MGAEVFSFAVRCSAVGTEVGRIPLADPALLIPSQRHNSFDTQCLRNNRLSEWARLEAG